MLHQLLAANAHGPCPAGLLSLGLAASKGARPHDSLRLVPGGGHQRRSVDQPFEVRCAGAQLLLLRMVRVQALGLRSEGSPNSLSSPSATRRTGQTQTRCACQNDGTTATGFLRGRKEDEGEEKEDEREQREDAGEQRGDEGERCAHQQTGLRAAAGHQRNAVPEPKEDEGGGSVPTRANGHRVRLQGTSLWVSLSSTTGEPGGRKAPNSWYGPSDGMNWEVLLMLNLPLRAAAHSAAREGSVSDRSCTTTHSRPSQKREQAARCALLGRAQNCNEAPAPCAGAHHRICARPPEGLTGASTHASRTPRPKPGHQRRRERLATWRLTPGPWTRTPGPSPA